MIQSHAGVGKVLAIFTIGDAVITKLCQDEVVDLGVQRKAGSTNTNTCTVNIK